MGFFVYKTTRKIILINDLNSNVIPTYLNYVLIDKYYNQ